jgi:CubicO group peptidase (beta-lactamase class C family)
MEKIPELSFMDTLETQMLLDGDARFASCQERRKVINASSKSYQMMDIHMDEIGISWVIDTKNGYIWHNGGTGSYNSYLGICPDTQTAVVILSNLGLVDRISSTVLGVKLLQEIR